VDADRIAAVARVGQVRLQRRQPRIAIEAEPERAAAIAEAV